MEARDGNGLVCDAKLNRLMRVFPVLCHKERVRLVHAQRVLNSTHQLLLVLVQLVCDITAQGCSHRGGGGGEEGRTRVC